MGTRNSAAGGVFYGWWIVAAGFVVLLCGGGFSFYSFTVFVKPLTDHFGWSRAAISVPAGIWAVSFGLACPLAGWCVERFGARRTMITAAIATGAAYLLMAEIDRLWMLAVLMGVAGVAGSCATVIPVQTIVSHWFARLRGLALGTALLGIGFGGMVAPPATNWVIERWGWESAFRLGCGLMWLVVVPTVALWVRTRPEELGLVPDGQAEPAGADRRGEQTSPAELPGVLLRDAVATSAFWALLAIQILLMFGQVAISVHFVPLATEAGLDSQQAANFWGAAIGVSMIGRLGTGWLADNMSPRLLLTGAAALLALAMVSLQATAAWLFGPAPALFYLFGALYGLGLGSSVILVPVLVARCFGRKQYGAILGLVLSGFAVGAVLGPVTAGKIFDATGCYDWSLRLCLLAFAGVGLLAVAVRTRAA